MTHEQPAAAPPSSPDDGLLSAWVDESIHTPGAEAPEGMYVLVAAVADPSACEPVRDSLRALVPRGAGRLHWRDESDQRQEAITAAIVRCDLFCTVVIGAPIDQRRQERARRKCMTRLLHELEQLGVSCVWLESRTATLNRKDLHLVDALRGERAISRGLRVEFGRPLEEPMLWVPDAVAGAVSAARKGTDTRGNRERLGQMVTEYVIDL